jgi:hypothetical protein
VAERDDRALPSAARTEAGIEGAQHRVVLVGRGPCTLGQNTAQPLIAAVGAAGLAHSSAFVIAGAKASPGCQVGAGRKLRHVRTNFGKNRGGSFFFDARDGLQEGVRLPEFFRAQPRADLDVQGFDLLFEEIEMAEYVPQEER